MNEYSTFVRSNSAIDIVKKITSFNEKTMSEVVASRKTFGLESRHKSDPEGDVILRNSDGMGKISRDAIVSGTELIDKWKVIVSKVSYEHAGTPDKDGTMRVLSVVQLLPPNSVCTESYLVIDSFDDECHANNCMLYLKTKFARFLIMQMLASMNMSKASFQFLPVQDFSESWSDTQLYEKYGLTSDEICHINSTIKSMDNEGDDDVA